VAKKFVVVQLQYKFKHSQQEVYRECSSERTKEEMKRRNVLIIASIWVAVTVFVVFAEPSDELRPMKWALCSLGWG
jgi:Na+/H+ antiporter NhaD/arsenite permease-like protein